MIIGTGIDIVEIERLRKILAGASKDRFLQRVFTPEEQQFCLARRDPTPHFSARFAAKEAFFKALGTGCAHGATWLEVQVRRQEGDAPTILLQGTTLQLSIDRGVEHIHLSLTHTGNWAAAMVTLE